MTTLRELIKDKHDQAEQHVFTKLLLSGNIEPDIYSTLLANQLLQYKYLEDAAKHIMDSIPGLARADLIFQDLVDLDEPVVIFDTTTYRDWETDRKSTRLNSSHLKLSRMPSSA